MNPKTAFTVLELIGSKWLDIQILWMNVRIDRPRTLENVQFGHVKVDGTYRTHGRKNLVLFHRSNNTYWPQGKPILEANKRQWKGEVHIGDNGQEHHSIVVAIASPDIQLLIEYFQKVHGETGIWVGIQFSVLPLGLKVLDEHAVYGNKPN